MRKLSILLLLIGIPFMIIEANNLSTQRTKIIRWHKCQKTPNSIPIEAIQDENSIEERKNILISKLEKVVGKGFLLVNGETKKSVEINNAAEAIEAMIKKYI
jgi:hypothetical protein